MSRTVKNMMDISAHGNHFEHDNGYQGMNNACLQHTNYPTQFQSNSGQTSTAMGFYHHSLYSQTALEYGITTSNSPVPPDAFYDCSNSYSGTPPQDHHHIISSDNGLSYTNLDYMYSQAAAAAAGTPFERQYHQPPEPPPTTTNHPANYSPNINWMHHQHHMHHPAYSIEPMLNGNAVDKLSCKGYGSGGQHIDPDTHGMIVTTSHQSTSQQLSQQQPNSTNNSSSAAPASNVPTYKWMQVKRNVPKPQSKCIWRAATADLLIL